MAKRLLVLGLVAVMMLVCLGITSSDTGTEGLVDTAPATRADELVLDNAQLTVTSNKVYTSITMLNQSQLTIKGTTVLVYGEVVILGTSEFKVEQSTVTLKGGSLIANCAKFKLVDSEIIVKNETTPDGGSKSAGAGEDGYDSSFQVKCNKDNIAFTNSIIRIEGSKGGTGMGVGHGGEGGYASCGIETDDNGLYKISMDDSTIKLTAGKGGDSGSGASDKAGDGGDCYFNIRSFNKVEISNTEINCSAGQSGEKTGQGSYGINGESMEVKIEADDDIIVDNGLDEYSTFWSKGGSYTSDLDIFVEGNSQFKFLSGKSIIMDENKQFENEYYILTNITAKTVYMEAEEEGFLYNVAINNPSGSPKTNGDTINVYWWLYVSVYDNSGQALENADVTVYYASNDQEVDSDKTDSDGLMYMLLKAAVATTTTTQIIYDIEVSTRGITEMRSNRALYTNTLVEFPIKLVSVEFTSIQSQTPAWGMTVGGMCVIRGTASPPPVEDSHISLVTVKIDGTPMKVVQDGEAPDAYSAWHVDWDTTDEAEGMHEIIIWASDGNFNSETSINVTVNQDAVNHLPEIVSVSIPQAPKGELKVSPDSKIYVNGTCTDEDFDSDGITQGKGVSKVVVMIFDQYDFLLHRGETNAQEKTIDTWTFSYRWDVKKKNGDGSLMFDDGTYKVYAFAVDNGNPQLMSLNNSDDSNMEEVIITHIQWPKLIVQYEGDTIGETLTVTTGKGDTSITILFDASNSYDPNGPNYKEGVTGSYSQDLLYYWLIAKQGKDPESQSSTNTNKIITLEYTFEFAAAEEEKETRTTYDITLTIEDAEGLRKTQTFTLVINIIGPDKQAEMPLVAITHMAIPLATPLLFLAGLGLFVAVNAIAGVAMLIKRVREKNTLQKRLKGLEIRKKLRQQQYEKRKQKDQFVDYEAGAKMLEQAGTPDVLKNQPTAADQAAAAQFAADPTEKAASPSQPTGTPPPATPPPAAGTPPAAAGTPPPAAGTPPAAPPAAPAQKPPAPPAGTPPAQPPKQ